MFIKLKNTKGNFYYLLLFRDVDYSRYNNMKWADEVENGSTWAGEEQTRAPPKKEAAAEVRTLRYTLASKRPSSRKRKKKLCQYYKKSTPANRYPIVDIYKKGSGSQIEKEREFVCGKHKKTSCMCVTLLSLPGRLHGGCLAVLKMETEELSLCVTYRLHQQTQKWRKKRQLFKKWVAAAYYYSR